MVKAFFGESGIPYAILYVRFGSFLAFATYVTVILDYYSEKEQPKLKSIVWRTITFPSPDAYVYAVKPVKDL